MGSLPCCAPDRNGSGLSPGPAMIALFNIAITTAHLTK
jgi:hypothetical protein